MSSSSVSTASEDGGASGTTVAIVIIGIVVFVIKMFIIAAVCQKRPLTNRCTVSVTPDDRSLTLTMDKFLNDIEREKPIRFTSQQLRFATDNFTNFLGSGGFGAVFKGIFSNGTVAAVKVLHANSYKSIEEQFKAEETTIALGVEENDRERAERMMKVALWHILGGSPGSEQPAGPSWNGSTFDFSSSMVTESSLMTGTTPIMKKYEIELAASA
ncbi:hypothetical protein Patl1_14244 [Pistacia atlantica]|uniref:Uncharacterized protein n=1 Tax=Pistacia atlantica TaxID=434234 RepID=A0ACC1AWX4_9ROSI|nr:hypothetical protein Patl1_14244 [Pistacia atlantica]